MVLFLFVIMLLGAEQLRQSTPIRWQQPLAIGLGLILIAESAYVLFLRSRQEAVLPPLANLVPDFGSPRAVGEVLFNQYLLPFEVTSVLLLVAMIGAIVLTRYNKS
jgi:NADH-quinone oxidoreductase subunit J